MDPTYPLFPIFAFLGFILALIPLPWHFQAWNSGTCFYMMWASLACLNQFVNSVVWHGNALNPAPFWCEISIRIMMGASVGLPAASLCINRRLYCIACVRTVGVTRSDKLRAILIDSCICVLFPLIYIAVQYVVQGHRFNIIEDVGCYPALYNTLPTYFLSNMWPIVVGLISAVYCVLSLRSFARRRLEFSQFLSSNKSSLTISRYFRLMGLAMADIAFTTPPAAFLVWLNATATPIGPWRSWADTHFDFSRVEQIPALIWRQDHLTVVGIEFSRWVTPVCAVIFFAFFGFADEARKHYRAAFWSVAKVFGYTPATIAAKSSSNIRIGPFKKTSSVPVSSKATSLPPYSPPSSSTSFSLHEKKRQESLTDSLSQTNDDFPVSLDADSIASSPTTFQHDISHLDRRDHQQHPYPVALGSNIV